MITPHFVPLIVTANRAPEAIAARAVAFRELMRTRRTVRHFSNQPVAREVIETCLMAAGGAPSGANLQPWHFVVVSDQAIKQRIRLAAEEEEREFYSRRAPQEWLDALAPLGTDADKPFLEAAPYLIAIFSQTYGVLPDGRKVKNYYVQESVGIATGMLITAIHHAGLTSLTHTPSPMGFLNDVLNRPPNENRSCSWLSATRLTMRWCRTSRRNRSRRSRRSCEFRAFGSSSPPLSIVGE